MTKLRKYIFLNWQGYLCAIVSVVIATWLKSLAQPLIIPANVPILYMVAIIPTAIFFGFGPSILVCILSLLSFDFFFLHPIHQINLADTINGPLLVIFLGVGILFSYLSSNLRSKNLVANQEISARKSAEKELLKHQEHLEDMVKQRTAELQTANSDLKQEIITRKQIEEALRKGEQRWATTLASIGDAVIATDIDGKITFINPAAESLTGWTLNDASSRPVVEVFNIIDEHTRQKVDDPVAKVIQHGIIVGLANHTLLIRKDKTEISIDDSGAPIKDETGEITGAVLVFRDITDRKQLEEALSYERDKLNTILNSMEDGLYLVNHDCDIEYVNPALESLIGPVNDQKCYRYFHNQSKVCQWCKNSEILQGKHVHWELSFSKTGRVYDMTGTPLKSPDGRILVQEILHDITERKLAEERLRQSEEQLKRRTAELEATNKELEAFSYSVSHDLRAPLRSLNGFSQMVLDDYADRLGKEGKDYLNRIREASQLMSRLIDDMLGLSRVVRVELNFQIIDLSHMANKIAQELKITEPGRQVDFDIAEGIRGVGDANLLHSVLQNLLGNSFKFTAGRLNPLISFGVLHKNSEKIYYVSDNGAGFDVRYADKLFKPFQRLHSTREFPGTGIGLATVQRIIYRHGGRIWAEGQVDKGATFYFTLKEDML